MQIRGSLKGKVKDPMLLSSLEPELPTFLLSLPGFCITAGNLPRWDHCREVC